MERLELLSLVNRVSQEIFNFTGNQDKTLAEFVISVSILAKWSRTWVLWCDSQLRFISRLALTLTSSTIVAQKEQEV